MKEKKILYVSSEVVPYLPENEISSMSFEIPKMINKQGGQIRIFMPRYGNINERRHQLHEVIRLSGINLVIDDLDMPLIIKVASIPKERIQVYFIDNEEYFKKKFIFKGADGKYFKDNDERSMFFCRGVLETVKKLGWMPDIVHCHGWMTALMPVYLRSVYKNDPHFSNAKIIYAHYKLDEKLKFSKDLPTKLDFDELPTGKLNLNGLADVNKLHEIGIQWSDAVSHGTPDIDESLLELIKKTDKSVLEYHDEEQTVEAHQNFYDKVLSENGVLV